MFFCTELNFCWASFDIKGVNYVRFTICVYELSEATALTCLNMMLFGIKFCNLIICSKT